MRRALMLVAVILAAAPSARAEDAAKPAIVIDRPGVTIGKVDGQTVILKETPTGTVGRIGQDKVLLHGDRAGNSVGKVGDKKMICHSDPRSGLTLCK